MPFIIEVLARRKHYCPIYPGTPVAMSRLAFVRGAGEMFVKINTGNINLQ